eukprot:TRINITY_DN67378_c1_g3_i2.p1 TRINITY_DN67378_c1_g3~~TRINITY_DN67378_c1_g3_i2.p1  ORF type:complete len:209 (-),score=32.35 TRINITY_DN67378_c1_g3_i2:109-735(-)
MVRQYVRKISEVRRVKAIIIIVSCMVRTCHIRQLLLHKRNTEERAEIVTETKLPTLVRRTLSGLDTTKFRQYDDKWRPNVKGAKERFRQHRAKTFEDATQEFTAMAKAKDAAVLEKQRIKDEEEDRGAIQQMWAEPTTHSAERRTAEMLTSPGEGTLMKRRREDATELMEESAEYLLKAEAWARIDIEKYEKKGRQGFFIAWLGVDDL